MTTREEALSVPAVALFLFLLLAAIVVAFAIALGCHWLADLLDARLSAEPMTAYDRELERRGYFRRG